MTPDIIKELLDACYLAKRARELLPPLPEGVAPAFIQYLDIMKKLQKEKGQVKVSDISDSLGLPKPGVTRTVKEMEKQGYVQKIASPEDKRIVYLTPTEKGFSLSNKYDVSYYRFLSTYLEDLSDQDVETTIRTIEKFHAVMASSTIDPNTL